MIGEQPSFQVQRQPENGIGTAASSSTSAIANQPLALVEALMESAAPEGLAEQAFCSSQDGEAHRAKLEKYGDWLILLQEIPHFARWHRDASGPHKNGKPT